MLGWLDWTVGYAGRHWHDGNDWLEKGRVASWKAVYAMTVFVLFGLIDMRSDRSELPLILLQWRAALLWRQRSQMLWMEL